MRLFYKYLIAFMVFYNLNAQENNHWILGNSDLNFTTITPTANVLGSNNYGSSTISDTNGDLLFYTDGKKVWNKNHSVMTNGNQILDSANIINTIITPNPNNSNQYYIFSSYNETCLCGTIKPSYYAYSIVEFNVANPLGIVLNIGMVSGDIMTTNYSRNLRENGGLVYNSFYYVPLTSSLISNGSGFWLIAQFQDKLLSYKIDNVIGLNLNPIVSTFSTNQIYKPGTFNSSFGSITGNSTAKFRIAPNNNFLIGLQMGSSVTDPVQWNGGFYKVDFNPTSGTFSNFQNFYGTGINLADFEISENSNNMFFIRNSIAALNQINNGEVLVKDLNNLLSNSVLLNDNASQVTQKFSFIQKDRNNNILISSGYSDFNRNKYLHKINNQNSFTSCLVQKDWIYLNNYSIYKLPQLIPEQIIEEECTSLVLSSESNTGAFTYQNYSDITTQTNYNLNVSTQDITMKAEDFVVLKPNSHIKANSKLWAKIQPCEGAGKTSESNIEYQNIKNSDVVTNLENLEIYPNPTDTEFNINSKDEIIKLTIFSLEGKLVFEKNYNDLKQITTNVSELNNGLYFVNIYYKNGQQVIQKLIKK